MIGLNYGYFVYALPALILGLVAQAWVQRAYNKWLRVRNGANITGLDAARHITGRTGMRLTIEGTKGTLSDHYDPRSNTLRLSQGVAQQPSVASLAIVAHELGHAQQDAQSYSLLKLRSGLVPVVSIASWLGPLLFMAGLLLRIYDLAWVGVVCFGAAAVFSLVTLPVELNASRRGMALLNQSGLLRGEDEARGVRSVLTAAALTYVAGLVQSFANLMYYGSFLGGGRRSRG